LENYIQVFIELAKFNRALPEATPADKWIYLLKYMPELQQIPAELANEPFTHAFAIAEEAALSPDERWLYEGSLKQARDFNARLQYALETGFSEAKGKAEGKAESQREIARSMLARGLDPKLISEITRLTVIELNQLSKADV
jgi:predicted transposase/invertase (TIGR01784 family)